MTAANPPETLPESFSWSVRPLEYEPAKGWGIVLGSVLAWFLGLTMGGHWLLGFLGVLMVLGATAEFWMGSKYRISDREVRSQTGLSLSVLAWEDVKRVMEDEAGVRISPLENPSWRDSFRGVYLRWPKEGPEEVRTWIRRCLANG